MPPPPAVPATVQSNTPPIASNVTQSVGVSSSPASEVTSTASSGGMGSPSPQQMMPASIPDVPLFGTGPPTSAPAPVQQQMNSSEFQPPPMFNMSAMQAPLPPANMPIPEPSLRPELPIPPTATSSQIQPPLGNQQ